MLFQSTPVALLESDASALKSHLDEVLAAGGDVDEIARNPDALARCLAMIRTTDWNAALVELLEARDDQALDAVQMLAEAVGVGRAGPGDPACRGVGTDDVARARDLASRRCAATSAP